ncbi:ABC transporter permease [Herbidospora sp. NBRC 101105]|uniref:ABC transporter permease n=1 Tax=Herbidospora sp. NBRC 101105 TaxID=3032195 RepID=UPI00249FDBC1|nr:ABC transporter permease [Herbidospora sp. NBRC 101105]GLX95602.1 ABC transporter permease [Herbidospora sp. NBRC 101105]
MSSTFTDRLLGRVKPSAWVPLTAPLVAILFAALITSIVLVITGNPVLDTLVTMVEYGSQPRSLAQIVNYATTYYLSAIAVAIGFRMNLFNIGVDGQYRLAGLVAAAVGGTVTLPAPFLPIVIILVAMIVGAAWAGIAGVLKATRGVSEVISTIMLNTIATGIGAYLLLEVWGVRQGNDIGTKPIPAAGQVPGLGLIPDTPLKVYGLFILAVVVGFGFHVLLNKMRFGFDLRATGQSEPAAVASGVNVKRMIVYAMLISGAMAGLIGMPQLLGESYTYNLNFQAGLGFTGIAIALLGRNNPVGIVFAALLWAFLDVSANILDLHDVSPEIVTIMQGVIVLSVVVAYELAHRYRVTAEQRRVSRELAGAASTPQKEGATA